MSRASAGSRLSWPAAPSVASSNQACLGVPAGPAGRATFYVTEVADREMRGPSLGIAPLELAAMIAPHATHLVQRRRSPCRVDPIGKDRRTASTNLWSAG